MTKNRHGIIGLWYHWVSTFVSSLGLCFCVSDDKFMSRLVGHDNDECMSRSHCMHYAYNFLPLLLFDSSCINSK